MTTLQAIYSEAVQYYDAAHYDRAHELFSHLSTQLPMQPEVWKGLASCHQAKKLYPEALLSWGLAAFVDPLDPVPHFHAAECLLAQGNRMEASRAIRISLGLPCAEELLDQILKLKEIIDNG